MKFFTNTTRTSAVIIAAFLTQASVAQAEEYHCILDVTSARGWVAEEMQITMHSARSGEVLDVVTHHYLDGPARASIRGMRNGGKRISWAVNGTDNAGQSARLRYTAELKANNDILVSMRPVDFRGHFVGRGSCQLR